jgi:hypothetical protein
MLIQADESPLFRGEAFVCLRSSIPVHRVASEDIGQRLKGHVPLTQIERFFHLLTTPDQVGHDERGAQREDISGLLQPNAPQYQAFLFTRLVSVVKGEAGGERLREEFRMPLLRLNLKGEIFNRVSDASPVLSFLPAPARVSGFYSGRRKNIPAKKKICDMFRLFFSTYR